MRTLLCFFLLTQTIAATSQSRLDNLYSRLRNAKEDTARINACGALSLYYSWNQFDSSVYYAKLTLDMAERSNYQYGMFLGYRGIYFANTTLGNYDKALDLALRFLKVAEKLPQRRLALMALSHSDLGFQYRIAGNYSDAMAQFQEALRLQRESGEPLQDLSGPYQQLAVIYLRFNQFDSALAFAQTAYDYSLQSTQGSNALTMAVLGTVHQSMGHNELAEKYYRMGIDIAKKDDQLYFEARLYNNLAGFFKKINKPDSCIYYAFASLRLCEQHHFGNYAVDASQILAQLYESQNRPDSAMKYMKLMLATKDTVFSQQKSQQFQLLSFDEKNRQREIEAAKERYVNQTRTIALLAALAAFLIIGFILYRNYRLQRRARSQIEKAYSELKSAQTKLIQSEKMASLGELTAGIAHEIQNPLNFVNNFAEVNAELIGEMNENIEKGRADDIKSIAEDIKENNIKIAEHGKRAEAIVKGMLQHSRKSAGQKEKTDLNALADEYLRLSYHGMRAREKSFNATLQTDFDEQVGLVNIVAQNMGRVLLNLFNNAFYAVSHKNYADGVQPTVAISTRKKDGGIEIRVRDNGTGIPKKIIDKIFQPFFTTKPAGQGTGLGLSLSYDIIVKEHEGNISISTVEGEFCEFVIELPLR